MDREDINKYIEVITEMNIPQYSIDALKLKYTDNKDIEYMYSQLSEEMNNKRIEMLSKLYTINEYYGIFVSYKKNSTNIVDSIITPIISDCTTLLQEIEEDTIEIDNYKNCIDFLDTIKYKLEDNYINKK